MNFLVGGQVVDSVELKCLVVSRRLKIDNEVYQNRCAMACHGRGAVFLLAQI